MLKINLESIEIPGSSLELISDLELEIEENQVVTVLGQNGSGKTTLLNGITNLLEPEIYRVKGEILFEGKDLLKLDSNEMNEIRQKQIKYVFQDAKSCFDPLYKMGFYFDSIPESNDLLVTLLAYFNLPNYTKLSAYHSYELSGGMAQRIAVVLAGSANPNLLLFDEPTSALDYGSANLLKNFIIDFASQNRKSVVIVSQDIEFTLAVSDRILILRNGKLDEIENPVERETLLNIFETQT